MGRGVLRLRRGEGGFWIQIKIWILIKGDGKGDCRRGFVMRGAGRGGAAGHAVNPSMGALCAPSMAHNGPATPPRPTPGQLAGDGWDGEAEAGAGAGAGSGSRARAGAGAGAPRARLEPVFGGQGPRHPTPAPSGPLAGDGRDGEAEAGAGAGAPRARLEPMFGGQGHRHPTPAPPDRWLVTGGEAEAGQPVEVPAIGRGEARY